MRISNTDFTGFTFDGIHSSELNVYRVSDGDRYDEELIPEINDKTTEIPGNNGEYFWGSNYGKRTFSIKIAYDEVTEVQFRKIRRLFSTRKVVPIIFDERPYKVYYVKMESPIELNYICFDEPEYEWVSNFIPDPDDESNEINPWVRGSINHKHYTGRKHRIYKGEGTIELVAYHPYAHQLFKVLDYYEEPVEYANAVTSWANVDEWAHSSGILDLATYSAKHLDEPELVTSPEAQTSSKYNVKIPVYNPGDVNTGMYLYIPYGIIDTEEQKTRTVNPGELATTIVVKPISNGEDSTFTVSLEYTTTEMVEGEEVSTTTVGSVSFTKGTAAEEDFVDASDNTLATISYDGENTITATEAVLKSVLVNYTVTERKITPNAGEYIIINGDTGTLYLEPFTAPTDDNNFETGILINSNNRLIEGVHFDVITDAANRRSLSWKTTGRVYNDHIKKGEFPKILKSDWLSLDRDENTEDWDLKQAIWINCEQGEQAIIHYDYLYF